MTSSSKVALPDFFIALVIPGASREPNYQECDELKQKTIDYWTRRLKDAYPTPGFERIALTFDKVIFGARDEGHNHNLEPKFNMYLQASGDVSFVCYKSKAPTCDEVFQAMVSGDSQDFLVEFVRKVNVNSPFASAVHVCVRRLDADPEVPEKNVKAPTFYIAFGTNSPPTESPTKDQVAEVQSRTQKCIAEILRKEYPSNFVSCDLVVLKADVGVNKPDDRFPLYFEMDASALFSSDPISSEQLFHHIMKSVTSGTDYLISIDDVVPVTKLTIKLVVIEKIDLPELVVEEGMGDVEVVPVNIPIFLALVVMAEPPARLPSPEDLIEFSDLMRRYFFSIVKNKYPNIFVNINLKELSTKFGAGIPEERFNMCVEYDATVLFKKTDKPPPDMKLLMKLIVECNLSAVLAYVRTLKPLCFKKTTEVSMQRKTPKKKQVQPTKEMKLEAAIDVPQPIDPTFQKKEPTNEDPKVMKSPQKKVGFKLPETREEAESKLSEAGRMPKSDEVEQEQPVPLSELEKPRESPLANVAPEADIVSSKPTPDGCEKMPQSSEETPNVKATSVEAVETPVWEPTNGPESSIEAESKEPEPRVIEKQQPASSHEKELYKVQSSDAYVALKLDGVDSEPAPEEFEKLRQQTSEFFASRLKKAFAEDFVNMDLQIGTAEFGAGKPEPKYNLYVEWDVTATFASPSFSSAESITTANKRCSASTDRSSRVPGPIELTKALVKDAELMDYLVKYVRTIEKSSFANATAVYIQQRINA